MSTFALFSAVRKINGIAAAADGDQAGLLRDSIAKLVQLNPWLAQLIDVQKNRIINRHTESELRIITSDAASSYGLTPNFVIADEVTHWGNRDLWDSLLSSCAKTIRQHVGRNLQCRLDRLLQFELREKSDRRRVGFSIRSMVHRQRGSRRKLSTNNVVYFPPSLSSDFG